MVSRGKFYKNGNKNDEISAGAVNGTTIPAGSTENIYSCGRSDAASGTEGVIDLYEGDTKICTIYWSCPWGSKSNDFQVQNRNSKAGYMVSIGDWNRDSGALGKVEVEVAKKG